MPLTGHAQYPALTGLAVVALLGVVLVLVTGPVPSAGCWAGCWCWPLAGPAGTRPRAAPSRPGPAAELLGDRLAQGSGPAELHQHPVWPVLTLLAAVLLAVCGVVVAARAGRWKLGMSARYAAPAGRRSADPWRRLDRGEDPTVPDD